MVVRLLAWYDSNRRSLPWRAAPGQQPDPYAVWLSEVMLQQTTVTAVIPYFLNFLRKWPTVTALAAAPLDEVLAAWAGLGYYARARNLHKCAGQVAESLGGHFPDNEAGLRQLPGIGDYTAAAIAAIGFARPAVVVDGNVERVMARLFALDEPLPGAKKKLKALAARLAPDDRPGDYAQAVMDLGATLCTPQRPACGLCPWNKDCQGRALGLTASLPAKRPRATKPWRFGVAFWLMGKNPVVLLRRRPESGLLGGMMEIPSTAWRETRWEEKDALAFAPVLCDWRRVAGSVQHSFTHFHLEMMVLSGRIQNCPQGLGLWCALDSLEDQALPSVMRKVVRLSLAEGY